MMLTRRMPTSKEILLHWQERLSRTGKYESSGLEPNQCFACTEVDLPDLERAHILPKCMGGADDVGNLHLLCPTCHFASEPLTGLSYWRWFLTWSLGDKVLIKARIYEAAGYFRSGRDIPPHRMV